MARGGKRPGAGRRKGSKNKATEAARAEIAELARKYTPRALQVLIDIAESGQSEGARVSAATALLDRGHGRPVQATEVTGKDGDPLIFTILLGDAS